MARVESLSPTTYLRDSQLTTQCKLHYVQGLQNDVPPVLRNKFIEILEDCIRMKPYDSRFSIYSLFQKYMRQLMLWDADTWNGVTELLVKRVDNLHQRVHMAVFYTAAELHFGSGAVTVPVISAPLFTPLQILFREASEVVAGTATFYDTKPLGAEQLVDYRQRSMQTLVTVVEMALHRIVPLYEQQITRLLETPVRSVVPTMPTMPMTHAVPTVPSVPRPAPPVVSKTAPPKVSQPASQPAPQPAQQSTAPTGSKTAPPSAPVALVAGSSTPKTPSSVLSAPSLLSAPSTISTPTSSASGKDKDKPVASSPKSSRSSSSLPSLGSSKPPSKPRFDLSFLSVPTPRPPKIDRPLVPPSPAPVAKTAPILSVGAAPVPPSPRPVTLKLVLKDPADGESTVSTPASTVSSSATSTTSSTAAPTAMSNLTGIAGLTGLASVDDKVGGKGTATDKAPPSTSKSLSSLLSLPEKHDDSDGSGDSNDSSEDSSGSSDDGKDKKKRKAHRDTDTGKSSDDGDGQSDNTLKARKARKLHVDKGRGGRMVQSAQSARSAPSTHRARSARSIQSTRRVNSTGGRGGGKGPVGRPPRRAAPPVRGGIGKARGRGGGKVPVRGRGGAQGGARGGTRGARSR